MNKQTKKIKPEKTIIITARIALQNQGIVFELNESHSFKDGDFSLEEIDNFKTQLLANNLISINNFQKQVEEKQ